MIKIILIVVSLMSLSYSNSTSLYSPTKEAYNKTLQILAENKIKQNITKRIEDNIWAKVYNNYIIYRDLIKEQKESKITIAKIIKKKRQTKKEKETLSILEKKILSIDKKLELITDYSQNDPFKKLMAPPKIENAPTVDNPITIIEAITFKEDIEKKKEKYFENYNSLIRIIADLNVKRDLIKDKAEKKEIEDEINKFNVILDIFNLSKKSFSKKIEEIEYKIKEDIEKEVSKTIDTGKIILIFIIILILLKLIIKKFLIDNKKYYSINKLINVFFFTIFIIILMFSYTDDISYLITILGFASAGIAIAMKDWFMSLLGWIVILLGNSVKVGDRVKFVKEGMEYVGDIVDISLLRMTIQEDITLTTVTQNRRAGRMIFIPNNFIFTDMIANYSHSELKTVWDGIDIMITFDSDIQKANSIMKTIIKKYSKGYTDMTRKQVNKMRGQYSIRNANVEPRFFSSIETYGIKVSGWYLTNSYATLTLRSTISIEIIEAIQKEENVTIAYPTQKIILDDSKNFIEIENEKD